MGPRRGGWPRQGEGNGAAVRAPRPAERAPSGASGARVVLLCPETRFLPSEVAFEETLRSTLTARVDAGASLEVEHLDPALLEGDDPHFELRSALHRKYAGRPIDLIVAADSPSLGFALRHRAELFSGAPVIFSGVERAATARLPAAPDTTGVWLTLAWAETLEAALCLQPESRRAVIVGGASGLDRDWLTAAREQLAPYGDRVEIWFATDRTLAEVLQEVAVLPAGTVLLVGTFQSDASAQHLVTRDIVARIAAASSVPAYGLSDALVGSGIVGGCVVSLAAIGARTAELAARVLRGERPAPSSEGTSAFAFDWRQLRRWRLDAGRLPAGSAVRFRPPSPWALVKRHIPRGAALRRPDQALLALLGLRARRRRDGRAQAERQRFAALVSELSAAFVAAPAADVDRQIARALRRIAEALEVDRATLGEVAPRDNGVRVVHAWARAGIDPVPDTFSRRDFPWMDARLRQGRAVSVSQIEDLSEEAPTDRLSLALLGTRSLVAVPLAVGGSFVGVLVFATLWARRDWTGEVVQWLRLLGEIFASALARRRAEDEARRRREELAHVLRVTTLGELASSLAHEVNQPLAAIMANAQAARRLLDAPGQGGKELREAMADIADDARHASQVIGRLRALCRREATTRELVDINALIAEAWGLVRADVQRRRIAVRISPGSRLPPVLGDRVQLQQVVLNALVNACEAVAARGDGPRTIAIETRHGEPGHVEIATTDSGVGVKEDDLERIFEPFTSSKPDGLGMGLSISRSIVEAHGGRVWASSRPEGGLTLCVALPAQESAAAPVAEAMLRGRDGSPDRTPAPARPPS